MKKKILNKSNFSFYVSILLILSIVLSYMPIVSLYAQETPFLGINDVEVEENIEFNLLENVSAHCSDGEELQVVVSNVVCETDNSYKYDGSNTLVIGKAGSIYRVQYTATSLTDTTKKYTESRKITSIDIKKDDKYLSLSQFDKKEQFMLSSLDEIDYNIEMENVEVSTKYFELECENAKQDESLKDILEFDNTTKIKGGNLKHNVPPVVYNSKGHPHSYIKAHIGNVQVYYVGILHIEDNGVKTDYIYYTTDMQITDRTVYSVLKENEKITLSYSHDVDYLIDYKFKDENGNVTTEGPDGWSYDDVFGVDRAMTVVKGQKISNSIKIPRGYIATISSSTEDGHIIHQKTIGNMMKYEHSKKGNTIDINQIEHVNGTPDSIILEHSCGLNDIRSNIIITVQYKKINKFTFNAKLWTETVYAKNRITVHNSELPNDQNCILTSTDNSFVWEFEGITAQDGIYWNTWEMDQLEINDEAINVPMTPLADKTPKTLSTTLSTGTKVKMTVTSKGGQNGNRNDRGLRHYRLEITDCYEDLTISGGNMISHFHKEYALKVLHGIKDGGYYAYSQSKKEKLWLPLEQDTLIGQKGRYPHEWSDPFRFKRQYGFYTPDISFVSKAGEELQVNGEIKKQIGDNNPYIEYLIRTDLSEDPNNRGEYKVVPFDKWKISPDGYHYFRGTNKLRDFAEKQDSNGVIFVNISSKPIKFALDYQSGNDETGKNAPAEKNIMNVPAKQYGGNKGYNVDTKPIVPISNMIPVDKNNEFVFDHWEVMETSHDEEHKLGYITGKPIIDSQGNPVVVHQGDRYNLTIDFLKYMHNCLYFEGQPKSDNGYAVATLRAVWTKRKDVSSMPYSVRYVLGEVKNGKIDKNTEIVIEEHSHMVNEGAMLVTDLYEDGNKTLSKKIQHILQGKNQNNKDYTEKGHYNWVVYEPYTTKIIKNVNTQNNLATIYLIKENSSIDVKKTWGSPESKENEVNVLLQRRKDDSSPWENVDNVKLSDLNQWKHTFDVTTYYDINNLKQYNYRAMELDDNNNIVKNGEHFILNGNTYQVEYIQNTEANKFEIKNSKFYDLTISKVVSGGLGDRTKQFTFDITVTDSDGNPLNGMFNYIGNIKNGYEQQSVNPGNGSIEFINGNGRITLSHGQQIKIKNISINSNITVSEQNVDGYTTVYDVNGTSKNEATLTLVDNSVVDVINIKAEVPDTGINNGDIGIGALILISIIGIISLAYVQVRRRKGIR